MRSFKLILAYDGTAYAGWQVQPGRTTLQGVLEATLEKIVGRPVRVVASGRTDAGVHALAQVVAFQAESGLAPDVLQRALNAELPQDMAVLAAEEVSGSFHPIRDAVRKRYRYLLHDGPVRDVFARRYCWHYRSRLDAAGMAAAAGSLLGTHDFRSFETSGAERSDSIRTIYDLPVRRDEPARPDMVILEVEADGFLYNMVRAIVGTLVEVGRGARPASWVADVLAAGDRGRAGPTAPPQGLVLVGVTYREHADVATL